VRSRLLVHAVDSHTEGMPTRVVVGGLGVIPGATMFERRQYFVEHLDHIRTLLMYEPRGHSAMSGAILQPPTRPDADYGVLYIEVSGCLPMCGHGTIGVATVLVETGMVPIVEPVTTVRLDTPAGLVAVDVAVCGGRAEHATLRNVPAFTEALDRAVTVDGIGEITYDMAWGGNFYAILPLERVGIPFERGQQHSIVRAGLAVLDAINTQAPPHHPENADLDECRHVLFTAPGVDGADGRDAVAIHPGWLDRSPCGTGTSARMAALHARGELPIGVDFVNESLLGTRFTGQLIDTTTVGGVPAVVPTVTGRAWITATSQFHLDPTDPFPAGFLL
jgi:proline racemase